MPLLSTLHGNQGAEAVAASGKPNRWEKQSFREDKGLESIGTFQRSEKHAE